MILVQTTQAQLLGALQGVAGVVERRHTLPILANVLLRKTGASIELTTSDLERQLRSRAELGGDAVDFTTTLSARKLVEILRAMPADQTVTLAATKNRVTLQGGDSRFTLQTLPAGDFPLVQDTADFGPAFALPQALLRSLIEQVEFAMAVQDIRYFLNGLLFITEGRRLTLVASDGNRLALAQAELDAELPAHQVILPRKTVHELLRLMREGGASSDSSDTVTLRFAAAQARFDLLGIEFVSKLIEGRFPDYRRVIPTGHRKQFTLGRAPLLASLQRASIMTNAKFRGVRMQVGPGALRIASSNAEHEEADERLAVDYGGDGLEIGFNVSYLMDVLGHSSDELVTIALEDAQSSALFTFPAQAGFQYVVSPMRL
jgi:DNA polymerase-3 subunit beta